MDSTLDTDAGDNYAPGYTGLSHVPGMMRAVQVQQFEAQYPPDDSTDESGLSPWLVIAGIFGWLYFLE